MPNAGFRATRNNGICSVSDKKGKVHIVYLSLVVSFISCLISLCVSLASSWMA